MSDLKKDKIGQEIKKTDTSLSSIFNDFLNNDHHSFVVLKSEKLASALYMVTGFVSESDPLRTRLRVCALDLVSSATTKDKVGDKKGQEGFTARCLEIGSMLTLAERAGLVSNMNARVLCEEYAALAAFVRDHHDKIFGQGTFDVHTEVSALPTVNGTRKRNTDSTYKTYTAPPTAPRSQTKKTPNSKRHQNRRDTILALLDKKDKINIKDAAKAIEGCSEKTIQRELLAMVDQGVLLKEGERRWSTYRKAA